MRGFSLSVLCASVQWRRALRSPVATLEPITKCAEEPPTYREIVRHGIVIALDCQTCGSDVGVCVRSRSRFTVSAAHSPVDIAGSVIEHQTLAGFRDHGYV